MNKDLNYIPFSKEWMEVQWSNEERAIENGLERIATIPKNLNLLAEAYHSALDFGKALDKPQEELWDLAERGLLCKREIFKVKGSDEKVSPVLASILTPAPIVQKKEIFNEVEPAHWLGAFYLAVMLRDRETIEWLANYPLEIITNAYGNKGDKYRLLFVEFLQLLLKKDITHSDKLKEAYEAAHPQALRVETDPYYALNLWSPEMECYTGILLQDEAYFNEKLENALFYYRKFIKDKGFEHKIFIARGLVAAAALAHDNGIQVKVTSDYLPTFLVRGNV
ncbi:MAG: immunity 49 family protein [Flavobacteriales bacterium]|nr:immunity 49 family protein [Flavobacteriales bacterium]